MQLIHPAARPPDLEQIDRGGRAQSEMCAQVVLGWITTSAADFIHLAALAGHAVDARANAAAIRFLPDGLYLQPVVPIAAIAPQQSGYVVHVVNDDIDFPIVVEVPEGGAASHRGRCHPRASLSGNVFKSPASQVPVQDFRLAER